MAQPRLDCLHTFLIISIDIDGQRQTAEVQLDQWLDCVPIQTACTRRQTRQGKAGESLAFQQMAQLAERTIDMLSCGVPRFFSLVPVASR